tara:strand:- start:8387 stop:8638 length:252 start_codon:yes stop_codon:yes gene_type:complete
MEVKFILTVFQIIDFIIIARIFLSWVPINIDYRIKNFIYSLSEPILKPFRDLIPTTKFGIDFSPILAFIFLRILQDLILNLFN